MSYKGYIIERTELMQYIVTYNNVRLVFDKITDAWHFIDLVTE